MTDYYDVKNIKNEKNIVVRVGIKKSSNKDPAHPPFIVCKEGTGANEDCEATLLLQETKTSGILPVITRGEDYFIRVGYPEPAAKKWSEVREYADTLLAQAIPLSLAMLDTGIVDKDRKVMQLGSDAIAVRNIAIVKDQLFFFDFEPSHIINWNKKLTYEDEQAISAWKISQENVIKRLAANLGVSPTKTEQLIQSFHKETSSLIGTKGKEASVIWEQILNPQKEISESQYQPPDLTGTNNKSPQMMSGSYQPPDLLMKEPQTLQAQKQEYQPPTLSIKEFSLEKKSHPDHLSSDLPQKEYQAKKMQFQKYESFDKSMRGSQPMKITRQEHQSFDLMKKEYQSGRIQPQSQGYQPPELTSKEKGTVLYPPIYSNPDKPAQLSDVFAVLQSFISATASKKDSLHKPHIEDKADEMASLICSNKELREKNFYKELEAMINKKIDSNYRGPAMHLLILASEAIKKYEKQTLLDSEQDKTEQRYNVM